MNKLLLSPFIGQWLLEKSEHFQNKTSMNFVGLNDQFTLNLYTL